jgi:hypothetical protein
VGCGVGGGGGTVIVTVPPSAVSLNLSRLAAAKDTVWVPTARVVDQRLSTPDFQFVPPSLVIAWATPSTITDTCSGAEPSRLRYVTAKTIVVVGVADRGETCGSISFVGPSTARTGATRAKTTNSAAQSAASGIAAGRRCWVRRRLVTMLDRPPLGQERPC